MNEEQRDRTSPKYEEPETGTPGRVQSEHDPELSLMRQWGRGEGGGSRRVKGRQMLTRMAALYRGGQLGKG